MEFYATQVSDPHKVRNLFLAPRMPMSLILSKSLPFLFRGRRYKKKIQI